MYDVTKGWFHRPLSEGQSDMGGPDRGAVHINSLGFRGPEVSRQKAPGVFRVLVFGDSFVFGVGVDENHLISSHLATLLGRSGRNGSVQYEVVNMGVSGYSTDQEYILFEEIGSRLAPDLVVLFCVDNDFEGNLHDFAYHAYYKPYFVKSADGSLVRRNSPVPTLSRVQHSKLWLGREANLWNAFRSRDTRWPPLRSILNTFQVAVPQRTSEDPVQLMHGLLLLFRERAQAMGAPIVVFNTGHRGERTPLFQQLRERLRADGFNFLGLEETLGDARRRQPDGHWDFGTDTHWNIDAHRLVAEVVNEYLIRNQMLPQAANEGNAR